jgi:sugar phosphate isomerase/epimerase
MSRRTWNFSIQRNKVVKIGCKIDEVRVDGSLEALQKDLDYFQGIGMGAVEVPVHGLDAIKNGVLDRQRVKEVRDILTSFEFDYSVHSPNPLNLMDEESIDQHMNVFRSSLEFTAEIGARVMVYHAGRFNPEETFGINGKKRLPEPGRMQMLENERDRLCQLSLEYPEVTICIENARPYVHHSPYCYGERLDALNVQVELIDRPNVRINLDIGHLNMSANFYGFDPVRAARDCRANIAHTHIHDNFGKSVYHYEKQQTHQIPFGRGDSHMPVGWGSAPISEILSAYLDTYDGLLIMELRSRYFKHTLQSGENLISVLSELKTGHC